MKFRWLLVTVMACALGACGGGSSSGGLTSNVNNPIGGVPLLVITPDNAEQMSAEVMQAVDSAFNAGESAFEFGGAIGARVAADSPAAAKIALTLAEKARDSVVSASNDLAVGVVISEMQDCEAGGTATVSIDTGSLSQEEFANALQQGSIPAGTSVSVDLDACAESDQAPLSGSVTIVFQQFSVDGEIGLDTFTMEFSATFDNLETAEGSINGDISLLLTSGAGTTESRISGNSLELNVVSGDLALLEFLVSATEDSVAQIESFDFDLSVSGFGQVSVETLDPWTTNLFAENPISGVLRILGAQSTSITVTALDEVNVQLEVDTDGDGVPNVTVITTWAELNS